MPNRAWSSFVLSFDLSFVMMKIIILFKQLLKARCYSILHIYHFNLAKDNLHFRAAF